MRQIDTIARSEIKAIECRHVCYIPPPMHTGGQARDYHLVKEIVHTKDGRVVPQLHYLPDYKRDWYFTKEGFRNHRQKKEYELLSRLVKRTSRQTDLYRDIIRALNIYAPRIDRRSAFSSPYVYGVDISSTSLIKKKYQDYFKGDPTPATVCGFDTETDVLGGTEQIIIASATLQGKIRTAILRDYIRPLNMTDEEIFEALRVRHERYIKPMLPGRTLEVEYSIHDTPAELVQACFERIHQWMPDFVEIWNLDFDITVMLEALHSAGIDPADVFSDPSVPKDYRYFEYVKGRTTHTSSSGVVKNLANFEQWDTVRCPASFQFVDGMQAFYQIRMGQQKRRSYGLDAIAQENLKGFRKLRFEEDAHIKEGTLAWHVYMQKHCRLNYITYNQGDCVLEELIDEVTSDLAFTISVFGKSSDLEIFNSQPKRKTDDLHFELLNPDEGVPVRVVGTGESGKDPIDELTYSLKDWIIALAAPRVANNGLNVIEEAPFIKTKIYVAVADLDVKSSYPNNGASENISRSTCVAEVCSFDVVDEFTARMQGLGYLSGPTNSVEFCTHMYKLPSIEQVLDAFDTQRGIR